MPSVYAFSAPLNWLDWDPTYPKNPQTLAEYIRKYRKDKGLTIGEFVQERGIHKSRLLNWEVRARTPRIKSHIQTLKSFIPEAERVFKPKIQQRPLLEPQFIEHGLPEQYHQGLKEIIVAQRKDKLQRHPLYKEEVNRIKQNLSTKDKTTLIINPNHLMPCTVMDL